jgi:hypothetical protein
VERLTGFVPRERQSLSQEYVAGVEPFIHVDYGDAGFRIAGEYRGLDGCGAAMPRQQ